MQKIEKALYLIAFICFLNTNAFANPFIRLDSLSLAKTKKMIANGTASKETLTAYNKLIRDANKLLKIKNPTVVDKTIVPPTKNKHDYLSISRYWWPNTNTKDGLPWVRQDGKTNPETQTDAVDRQRLALMGIGVRNLSLAYYFTNNEMYAEKAISMIDTWFLNADTLMNPHLQYAQSVPGIDKTRPSGILDGRSLVMFIPDAINLLSASDHWNTNYNTQMTKWFTDYLTWLTTSELGIKGSEQENNHGSWYKFQVASLALYLGNETLVKNMVELAENDLDQMLDNEGGQTHELARSRSFFYSCFNLQALTNIAVLADKVGMDMWSFELENKKSLSLALNYLTPVVNGEKWEHNTLKDVDISDLLPILSIIPAKYKTTEYQTTLLKVLKTMDENKSNEKFQEFWLLHAIN